VNVLSDFVKYLLDHGKVGAAVTLALLVLIGAGIRRWWSTRSTPTPPPATPPSNGPTQTTQVSGVRTEGDVTVSPTQHHG